MIPRQAPKCGRLLFWLEKTTSTVVIPKSFRYAQSRRSGKPPSDEGGVKNL